MQQQPNPSQPSLLSSVSEIPLRKVTRCDVLAAFFRARVGEWIDGRVLANVAGAYAWRSRCSDLRHAPFNMRIENRQRRVSVLDVGGVVAISESRPFTISEYRFVREA